MAIGSVAVATDYDRLAREALAGGFTYSIMTGTQPATGYAFSPYPQATRIVPSGRLTASGIKSYADRHADLLALDDHYLGAWRQVTDEIDRVWLDVSVVTGDRNTATALGSAFDQLSVFDLATGTEIPLSDLDLAGSVDLAGTSWRGQGA